MYVNVFFCYCKTVATVQAYGGQPPAWVYVECARPFTELLGLRGYQLMVNWEEIYSPSCVVGKGGVLGETSFSV